MARQIGFVGGLSVENPGPRKKKPVELASAIGFVVERDEDDDEEDDSLQENGKA